MPATSAKKARTAGFSRRSIVHACRAVERLAVDEIVERRLEDGYR
jgi:hypothetical protein